MPHARFIAMLTYKAELVGIRVLVTEESYTSKASFLDGDPLPIYGTAEVPPFSGRRERASAIAVVSIAQTPPFSSRLPLP